MNNYNYKLFKINDLLIKKTNNLKIYNRNSIILPNLVGSTIQIHNGKTFIRLNIIEEMIGYKLGEFVKTRKTFVYKKKKK